MSSAKAALVIKLTDLLGFEDGANDVLDYLLTIESSEVRPKRRRRDSFVPLHKT